jgi:chemotaxis-related protein WspB
VHVVIWTSAGHKYATPSHAVIEVIPVVEFRAAPQSDPWIKGLFNYRGTLLPLLDASQLLGHEAGETRMFGRILVIQTGQSGKDDAGQRPVGLLVQRVLGSEDLDFQDDSGHPGLPASGVPFLGPVALTPHGTIQLTEPALFPVAHR